MAFTPDEWEALAAYATLRQRGLAHHAAIAAINLSRILNEGDELDEHFVARLRKL
jgi:hypothetical protein